MLTRNVALGSSVVCLVSMGRKAGDSSSSSSTLVDGLWTENFPNRLVPGPRRFGASESESEEDDDNPKLYSSSGGGDSVGWATSAGSLLWLVTLLPPAWVPLGCDTGVGFRGDCALPACGLFDGGRGIGAGTG